MYETMKPYSNKVLELIRTTWENEWCKVKNGIITFKGYNPPLTVDHTDGIGTKGYYHWKARTFKAAALDALAMNLNDLFMTGATPYKLQNHIFLPKDDNEAVYEIVGTLVEECKKRKIAITGGETSIHQNMNGMDISITMSGIHPLEHWKNQYHVGDTLIGFASNGLHSNGFTMVYNKLGGERPEYIEPTKIYDSKMMGNIILEATAMNHITGGAFTKLKNNLPKNADAVFKFKQKPQQIFQDLYDTGISSKEMYKTFNCGWGFVVGVNDDKLDWMLKNTGGEIIGNISPGNGLVWVESVFDGKAISY